MKHSKGKRGGKRPGSGPKKDASRAALGRNVNLTAGGMPASVAAQIVQALLVGDRENALGLVRNMILAARREEAVQLAEECARLLAPYSDLWGVTPGSGAGPASAPVLMSDQRKESTGRTAALLRELAGLVRRDRAATIVNYAFADQELKPRGAVAAKEDQRLAAVNTIKKKAEAERGYWRLVFELDEKRRNGTLTLDDLERLRAITPDDLAPE